MAHPSRPHLGLFADLWWTLDFYESCAILKTTSRGKQNPGIRVRSVERTQNLPGWPHGTGAAAGLACPSVHSTLDTHKCTHLVLHLNHLTAVYSVFSSRYSPLYLKYGKGQRLASSVANSNHLAGGSDGGHPNLCNSTEGRPADFMFLLWAELCLPHPQIHTLNSSSLVFQNSLQM